LVRCLPRHGTILHDSDVPRISVARELIDRVELDAPLSVAAVSIDDPEAAGARIFDDHAVMIEAVLGSHRDVVALPQTLLSQISHCYRQATPNSAINARLAAKKRVKIGAHTSIAGGIYKALLRGAEDGCDVIQIFTRSNQQWAARAYLDEELEQWWSARESTGVDPAMAHSSYLINLAATDRALREKSYRALADEYLRCTRLGVRHLVMHPGAHVGDGEAKGIARIAAGVDRLFEEQPDSPVMLLFENTAGQGTCLGHRFEHLRDLLAAMRHHHRAGICIDTCHTLAAGYEIRTERGYRETFAELDRIVGLDRVRAFHVNDSKKPFGSRVDRHEHIGRGALGLGAFRMLVNDPRFVGLPMAIETPKPDPQADRTNLAILRALVGRKRVTPRLRELRYDSGA
jgi:deoxyribonuclease IV